MKILVRSRERLASFSHRFNHGIGETDARYSRKFAKYPIGSSSRPGSHPAAPRGLMVAGDSGGGSRDRCNPVYEATATGVDTCREAGDTLLASRTPEGPVNRTIYGDRKNDLQEEISHSI